jgi:TolB-like protein/class 3 adenylate cyclase/Tfp pilus assembly protein PilF
MSEQDKAKSRLEIAHVLFIDIVDYSKLLTDEQSEALQELNQIVRKTEAAREAEAAGQLTILPTGDGMALVFTGSVEEPAECAFEISHALRAQPSLPVRMGIHSGPVHHVKDANERENIAGVGINIAQRVMDCGDAGHILVSKRVADDLAQQRRWQPYLHELGDVEVKHGVVVSLVNLYAETIGNPTPPTRIGKARGAVRSTAATAHGGLSPLTRAIFILAALLIALAIVSVIFAPAIMRSLGKSQVISPPQPPAVPSSPSFGDVIKNELAKKVTDELQKALDEKKQAVVEPSPTGSAIPNKSIAVLPFDNLSEEKSNAYFAEGIQDEILTRLSKIAALKVISRTSTQKYKSAPDNLREVGKQLGVAHLLEGSVQKIGNAVHISVQLIRAATDEHVWAESYNRKLDDVFGVEGEVATAIADQLNAKLSGTEQKAVTEKPTQNAAAYDAYLRGLTLERNEYSYSSYQQVVRDYAEAVRLDPNFGVAWARLAAVRSFLFFNRVEPSENTAAAVKEAADRAMQLAPEAGESWVAQGAYRYRVRRDFEGALAAYQEAQKRLPNSSFVYEYMAFVQRRLSRWQEAEASYNKALELDPRDIQLLSSVSGEFYLYLRRFDDALAIANRAIEISPDWSPARANKVGILQAAGRLAEAADELKQIPAESTEDFVVGARVTQALFERHFATGIEVVEHKLRSIPAGQPLDSFTENLLFQLGLCQEWLGQHEDARRTFTRVVEVIKPTPQTVVAPEANGRPVTLAFAYAGLGEKDKALQQAQQAIKDYDTDAVAKPFAENALAIIQAQFGDLDSAIAALPRLLQVPGSLTIADLKFNPGWDPLRKDPRFQKLLEGKSK